MTLSPLEVSLRRPASLPSQAYAAISESIAQGVLRPGQRLVIDRVAQQLGVSPTPVREAMGRLIHEGLVVESGNGRLEVMRPTPTYVTETFLVRAALEGLAAELATARFSDPELEELSRELERSDDALRVGDTSLYADFDDRLHTSICTAAGNAMLARQLDPVRMHVEFIRHYSQRLAGDHVRLSHAEHVAIIEALRARDASMARNAMEAHIRQSSARIGALIDFHVDEEPR